MTDLQLMHEVVKLALTAGEAILPFWRADVAVTNKADDSPVTAADLAAHRVIADGLLALAPQIPVLSEEDCNIPLAERQRWSRWWLVDPLDGTKEFIAGSEEFTVNIALVENGDTIEIDIPNRRIHLAISDEEMTRRREAMEAKGPNAWKPANRQRHVSAALQAYALLTTSADTGAVRDLSQVQR